MEAQRAFWRRIDEPGDDVCVLEPNGSGWRLEGVAVFRELGVAAGLTYRVDCDPAWLADEARVTGLLGSHRVDLEIVRHGLGQWSVNGAAVFGLEETVDLDLGFTPATNTLAIRRLDLRVGESADDLAAWLDVSTGLLKPLRQSYERRAESTYWYESPDFDYAAALDVTPSGFVRTYPGLWEMESG
jgi:uncharacterized protein